MSAAILISKDELEAFSAASLEAGGFQQDYARQSAELLVWANLLGAESHGVLRIPRYIEMVELRITKGDARPTLSREFGAIAVYDGDLVPGATGLSIAGDKAVELASRFGIGLSSIMRTNHAGSVGCRKGGKDRDGRHRHVGLQATDGLPRIPNGGGLDQSDSNSRPGQKSSPPHYSRHVNGGRRLAKSWPQGMLEGPFRRIGAWMRMASRRPTQQGQGGVAHVGTERIGLIVDDRGSRQRAGRQSAYFSSARREAGRSFS